MAENSKIEWTDHTFNPWIGCTKVSPGCANCYAESQDKFRSWTPEGWGKGKPRKRTSEANWRKPIAWNKVSANNAKTGGRRLRVFCASLADWLDPEVPSSWRKDLIDVIEDTSNLDWLLLTKRPHLLYADFDELPPNVWLGTSAEDQARWDERVPQLLRAPAAVRFVSAEPLLGPIDMGTARPEWLIVGGESGPKARPMDPMWAYRLRKQCGDRTSFFMKQMGGVRKPFPEIPRSLMVREFPQALQSTS